MPSGSNILKFCDSFADGPSLPSKQSLRNMLVSTFPPHPAPGLFDSWAFAALPAEPQNSPEEPSKGHVESTVYESLGCQAYKMGEH